jgi:hypothetical protein
MAYKARLTADSQERPARIVAALEPGLKPTKTLLSWLDSLPASVRLELRMGDIENQLNELQRHIEGRMNYWQHHTAAHRPAGEANAGLVLRKSLLDIIEECLPDTHEASDRQKQANERNRRKLVADLLADAGVEFPNEKKNRKRFIGTAKP